MSRPIMSVVVPTIGRPSLASTLESIDRDYAETIVVADAFGADPERLQWIEATACEYGARYLALDAGKHDTGSPQIALGMQEAQGDWLLNVGDDDVYLTDAFETMTAAILEQDAPHPLMFKVVLYPAPQRGSQSAPVVLWQESAIVPGRVTGQSFVCPNTPGKLGRWVNDWTFMQESVALHGGLIDWRSELVARCY